MPAPQIKSLARKAGKSEAEAEKLWVKAKAQAKKAKLKGKAESGWTDGDWAYVVGVFKNMLGIKESLTEDGIITGYGRKQDDWQRPDCPTPGLKRRVRARRRRLGSGKGRRLNGPQQEADGRYRVFLHGDEVQMIHQGVQVAMGENADVDAVRLKVQDLLDADVDSVFNLGGFVGTLPEIDEMVRDEWVSYCTEGVKKP